MSCRADMDGKDSDTASQVADTKFRWGFLGTGKTCHAFVRGEAAVFVVLDLK